jgi:hypothetical protein
MKRGRDKTVKKYPISRGHTIAKRQVRGVPVVEEQVVEESRRRALRMNTERTHQQ